MPVFPSLPLIGYCDRVSAHAGQTVAFKVSSALGGPYRARLVRIVSADPNPDGPGPIEWEVEAPFAGRHPSRAQAIRPGSYGRTDAALAQEGDGAIRLEATIWPTLPDKPGQTVLAYGDVALTVGPDGVAGEIAGQRVATGAPLKARRWYRIALGFDADSGAVRVVQRDLNTPHPDGAEAGLRLPAPAPARRHRVLIAAREDGLGEAAGHFNGKIEAPAVYFAADAHEAALAARWDFARDTPTTRIRDTGPNGLDGGLVNLPARAMTGAAWDGTETCWRHAPGQYGAIHFHDDDVADFGWDTDFTFTVPDDLPSGLYAARLEGEGHWDAIPFFVTPPPGERRAALCVVIPTFTYVVYGNHARVDFGPHWTDRAAAWAGYPANPAEHPELGWSTYNQHADGSGICHATHRRPLLTLRPGFLTFADGVGSGLRHLQADTHLIAWLHAKGHAYDIVTDHDLDEGGAARLTGYKAVTTTTHPEYHTLTSLNALRDYRDAGGKLVYLGGNGFYWRIARHGEMPDALEIRRGEGGIRAWEAEPGEYFQAFDGAYGGLWRRNGRPPQQLAGIGFIAQGLFEGSHYRRTADSHAADLAWVFEGIEGETFGDYGLSGGGAAGFELDCVDERLGTPEGVRVLARSEDHGPSFVLVPEELLTHVATRNGARPGQRLHADMIYGELPGGGAIFATGSITFCGSLPRDGFDNPVSRLLDNVLTRFLADGE